MFCRLLTTTLIFTAGSLAGVSAHADDLFSSTRISSPYGTPTQSQGPKKTQQQVTPPQNSPTVPQAAPIAPPMTLVSLEQVAKDAGFQPRRDTASVSFTVPAGKWNLPVIVSLESPALIRIVLPLRTFSAGQTLDGEQAMAILALNEQHRPSSFSYLAASRRLDLQQFVANSDVTADSFKKTVTKLGRIAAQSDKTWNAETGSPEQIAQAPDNLRTFGDGTFGNGKFGMKVNAPKANSKPYWELDNIGSNRSSR